MRISDWSADVFSSDLKGPLGRLPPQAPGRRFWPVRSDVRAVRGADRGAARSARRRRPETGTARQAAGLGGAAARILGIGLVGAHRGATGLLGPAPVAPQRAPKIGRAAWRESEWAA